ncbi:hypothetical protein ABXZ74_003953 [Vibrio parahaemolyticus]|uniref:hypothetical protein n=1 Tax=Vibrio parahaemolyticus TaxID=670 RepID=UPI00084A94D8|nr:hypothetical protein [Vibrio parahaemolyticus]EGR0376520.1 hypothetical protein [Vibrio parahaemolyticus]EJD0685798.1 hypothetical protein [Vibrio parahaemolyticus]EJG2175916.1 hypothetical protein [Vibrio parahaemolyticus]EJI6220643.1 hypothetical protein [Vibrio parahaemolyticus]ELA7337611.1 hypothetical protein [Vibrio parahaemolyticus]
MSTKKLASLLGVLLVSGCAQTMPDTHYDTFAMQWTVLHKCFNNGSMTPQLFAQAKSAFSYALGTWSYDDARLSSAIDDKQYYEPTEQDCRIAEANAYQMINEAEQRKQEAAENAKAFNDAMQQLNANKPVYCNTIGYTTICN